MPKLPVCIYADDTYVLSGNSAIDYIYINYIPIWRFPWHSTSFSYLLPLVAHYWWLNTSCSSFTVSIIAAGIWGAEVILHAQSWVMTNWSCRYLSTDKLWTRRPRFCLSIDFALDEKTAHLAARVSSAMMISWKLRVSSTWIMFMILTLQQNFIRSTPVSGVCKLLRVRTGVSPMMIMTVTMLENSQKHSESSLLWQNTWMEGGNRGSGSVGWSIKHPWLHTGFHPRFLDTFKRGQRGGSGGRIEMKFGGIIVHSFYLYVLKFHSDWWPFTCCLRPPKQWYFSWLIIVGKNTPGESRCDVWTLILQQSACNSG